MRPILRTVVAIAVLLVPAASSAASPSGSATAPGKTGRTARVQKIEPKACMKPAVDVVAGSETSTFSLSKCDGTPVPLAVDRLSLLARPPSAPKPKQTIETLSKSHGPDVAPGIRRLDPKLVQRLEAVLDHFRKGAQTERVELVSGVRPKSAGSYHQAGRALDFRLEGVTNEALVAFCKTLPDTGCGFYPNSSFVHLDVREPGAGHVAWIDVSRPGEAPKYVSAWPGPRASEPAKGDEPAKNDAQSKNDEPPAAAAMVVADEPDLRRAPHRRDGRKYAF